ncbi:MAG: PAS domain S-box protein [Bacteroidia bacterium]
MNKTPGNNRFRTLLSYKLLDSPSEKEYDDICGLAALICQTPIAAISLVTDSVTFFKSRLGFEIAQIPAIQSFDSFAIQRPSEILFVENAPDDPRFSKNPLVAGASNVVCYMGVPLVSPEGDALGALSVMDRKPRKLDANQIEALKALARQVGQLFELRKGQLALSQSKTSVENGSKRLTNIAETARTATWEWNIETGEVQINDRWAEISGHTKEALLPMTIDTWKRMIHSEDRQLFDEKVKECLEKKAEHYQIKYRMIHKEGDTIWINDRGEISRWDEDGKPLSVAGTHSDISQQKITEHQFNTITNNIPGVVFRYQRYPDGHDNLQQVSNGALQLWGFSAEEVMRNNRVVWERYDERDLESHVKSIEESSLSLSFWQHEWRYRHPDGSLRWHKGSGNPSRLADNSIIWDSIILDITPQKEAEAQLTQTLKALQKRVNEQTCLLNISGLSQIDQSLEELLQMAVSFLPGGCQYSDITTAAIKYKGKIYKTAGHRKTKWQLQRTKQTFEGEILEITIAYKKERPAAFEGPFLKEEQQLLESVVDSLALNINQVLVRKANDIILNATEEGIYGIDKNGLCSFINPSAAKMLGFTPAECIGKNINNLIHQHNADEFYVKEERDVYLANQFRKGFQNSEDIFWRKDGSHFFVNYSSTPILENGKVEGAVVTFNDITARKNAETQLQLSEKRYRSLVENGADAIVILGPDGSNSYVSPSITKVLGYTEEEALQLNLFEVIHPDDREEVSIKMQEVMQNPGKTLEGVNARTRHKDGSWRWLEANVTNLLHDPAINGIVDNFRDVTEIIELHHLLENANQLAKLGGWELNLDNNIIYWSTITKQIHEVEEDYMPSLDESLRFYPNGVKEEVRNILSEISKTGGSFDFERSIITAKGNERWVKVIGNAEMHDGKCRRISGSLQDISRQKITEIELQTAFEEKNNILESIGDAFFAIDKDWTVTYWNKEAEKILFKKKQEIVGENLWKIFNDATETNSFTEYKRAMDTGETIHFEDHYPTTGQWFEVSAYPSEKGLSVYFKDVSIRKIAEKQFRQSNERFEKIAEATNDAIWDFNMVENELFWGKGFKTLFGHDPEVIKPSFELMISLIHPEDRQEVMEHIMAFTKDPEAINWFFEYRLKMNDGTYAFVIDRAIFIRDRKGKALRAVGAITDISYRKEHEDSLKKLNAKLEARARELVISNAELEQFAYVASHDLQEPLRMVSSFLTQLEKKYGETLDDKAKRYIHFAVDGARRMRQIILDLLEFSRVGKHEEEQETIRLNEVTDEVLKLLHREIKKCKATIHVSHLPEVYSFRTPLIHIFQNLISNAIKYVDPNELPVVRIMARSQGNEWLISVSDNGIGIGQEYFDKIFVIFQRLHIKEEYSGTGMGLAIVKKSVEGLGGQIWLNSEEGQGSTFYFTLPQNNGSVLTLPL